MNQPIFKTWKTAALVAEAERRGLNSSTVKNRHKKGIRDPEKLFAPAAGRKKVVLGKTFEEWTAEVKKRYNITLGDCGFSRTMTWHMKRGKTELEALKLMSEEYFRRSQSYRES